VRIVAGAGHFFHGKLTEMRSILADWIGSRAAENP
jgi:alpha/beta superfamily hydrolase